MGHPDNFLTYIANRFLRILSDLDMPIMPGLHYELFSRRSAVGHKRPIPDSRVADYSVTSVDGPESATWGGGTTTLFTFSDDIKMSSTWFTDEAKIEMVEIWRAEPVLYKYVDKGYKHRARN